MLAIPDIHLAQERDAAPIARMSCELIELGLGWSWRPARVLQAIRHPATNVAVARHPDGALAGFGIMSYGDEHAHLALLAVAPSCRRRKLATALVAWLEASAVAAGLASVRLEARADNPAALALYGALGCRPAGRVSGYYNGEVDAVRFEKPLQRG